MSFEKIIHKLRDAWRQDIRQSLGGLPGYYWGEVTDDGEVLLDAVAPGAAPVPVDDLIGAAVGDRVLLVHVDGAFSVVGVAGRPRVGATVDPRQVYVTDADGLQDTVLYHSGLQADAIVQRAGMDVLVPTTPAYANSAASQRHVELNGVPRFATVAARDTAFPAPVDGQVCYVTGNGYYARENGAWVRWAVDTVTVPLASPFTSNICTVTRDMRTGLATISFQGLSGTPDNTSQPNIGNIPLGYRPIETQKFFIGASAPTVRNGRWMSIETNGTINIIVSGPMFGVAGSGGAGLLGSHTYRLATD